MTNNESGNNFGSTEMYEFLSNIWLSDETQPPHDYHAPPLSNNITTSTTTTTMDTGGTAIPFQPPAFFQHNTLVGAEGESWQVGEAIIPRQDSFPQPPRVCQKTVEDLWAEILISGEQEHQQIIRSNLDNSAPSPHRQVINESMTLEEFLIKVGVVAPREPNYPAPPSTPPQQAYAPIYGHTIINNTLMEIGDASCVSDLNQMHYGSSTIIDDLEAYDSGDGGVSTHLCIHGSVFLNPSNYSPAQQQDSTVSQEAMQVAPPVIGYVSSYPINDVNGENETEMADLEGGLVMKEGGKKRIIIDGAMEVDMERKQQKMMKNRESAARSRARKEAQTNELKAENDRLKHELAEMMKKVQHVEMK